MEKITIEQVRRIVSEYNSRFILHHTTIDDCTHSIMLMEKKGSAFARIYWYSEDATTVYLDYLSVNTESRRQGLGKQLQQIRERIGIELGATYSHLLVEKNKWMHEWYKRRGYADYENYDTDWIWMQKSLI
jgi:GNAT superfamily N-acetyltransferase